MAYNRLRILAHLGLILITLALLAWVLAVTGWYATAFLIFCVALAEIWSLIRHIESSTRMLADFFTAVDTHDVTRSFSARHFVADPTLAAAMNKVMGEMKAMRAERESQARFFQTLLAHMPVALILRDDAGGLKLLNPAARRLFAAPVHALKDCSRYGAPFATGLSALKPGKSALLIMARGAGPEGDHLKADASEIVLQGQRQTLISLQNIASELSAQELAAWQSVIRTMTHEVMNSLTPISSLSATALEIVRDEAEKSHADALEDAVEALEAVARRSAGLMRFVQDHRRLTHRLVVEPENLSLSRVFARLHRLLEGDMAARGIIFETEVQPLTLTLAADPDLIDQALINLTRNAMDALKGRDDGVIRLSAWQNAEGKVRLAVTDNGPGVPADQRDAIFIPFYTTKAQGTGVGLALVRQIAAVHGAELHLSCPQTGGAVFTLKFASANLTWDNRPSAPQVRQNQKIL